MFRLISTVTVAASSQDLVDIAIVKSDLKITGTAEDIYLQRLITRASVAAAQYCNRVFVVETLTDEFFPDREAFSWQVSGGLEVVQLSRWPVVQVTALTENGVALVDGTDTRLDASIGQVYRLDANAYPCGWSAWPIKVTYRAGYTAIKDDIQQAVITMIKAARLARTRDPSLKSETIDGVRTATWWIATNSNGAMTPDVTDLLENYRVPVVA